MIEGPLGLQHFISTNLDSPCEPLTRRDLIKAILAIGGGPREYDFRIAAKYLGAFGFSARKKVARANIIQEAESIAAEVGHGDKPDNQLYPFKVILSPKMAAIVKEKFPGWL